MENFQGSLKRAFRQAGPDPLMRIRSLAHRSKAACKGCALLQDRTPRLPHTDSGGRLKPIFISVTCGVFLESPLHVASTWKEALKYA